MNLRNIQLIWARELRDQLRDRRTLFVVAVLPMLMYPLLGTSVFQLAQFMRQHTGVVLLVGAESLDDAGGPPLVEGDQFATALFSTPGEASRLVVKRHASSAGADPLASARKELSSGRADVLVYFPDQFAERLDALRNQLEAARTDEPEKPLLTLGTAIPQPEIFHNSAREPSQVAQLRVERVLARWQQQIVRRNLVASRMPVAATSPFELRRQDVAPAEARDARLWSKLLPFIAFVWALTGAFYPAIDLCAGEKERGTLETLLASPAQRGEIVLGKLLTVMTFSIVTSLLNLLSLAVTSRLLIGQLASILPGGGMAISPPPLSALAWLVVALIPVSALFSALSIACASYARSTKEGQYYFMPLFLMALPLLLMPMSPGVELNLGNSLVPVMGIVLLLRSMIEGQMLEVATCFLPATLVTGICCWLATRWAVSQFNQESILFSESERISLRGWLASVARHRGAVASAGGAMACAAGIFLLQFVVRTVLSAFPPTELTFGYFAGTMLLTQLVAIALPALLIVGLLTTGWRTGLLLDRAPGWKGLLFAASMALLLVPAGQWLSVGIQQLYPIGEQLEAELGALAGVLDGTPSIGVTLFLLALLPAICEEIAFRGVILTGLRRPLGDAGAVLVSAALFGATHTILQQSLSAAILGVILGIIALRTGNLLACIVFHAIYNGSALLFDHFQANLRSELSGNPLIGTIFREIGPEQVCYRPEIAILGGLAALAFLVGANSFGGGKPQHVVLPSAAP